MLHRALSRMFPGLVLAACFGGFSGCGSDSGDVPADGATSDVAADGAQAESLVGTWTGHEVGDASTVWSFTFTATTAVVTTSGVEAYQGSYTVDATSTPRRLTIQITTSAYTPYVGKTANAIYKIEGTTLTFAGNEPGNSAVPTSFTPAGNTRVFTLDKQ